MAIGSQFAGLDMKNLIGGPLSASAEASVTLAQSTADFINKVGFNRDNSARTIQFKFQKNESDALGNPIKSDMSMEVPVLAIVPIPNLQIDEVNVLFDMEVKECEKSESALDAGGSFSGSASFGPIRVSISGSVSSHSSNTRSTDNSAKYHVDVRAANHGTPEGLARVLDIMAATVAPTVLTSKMVDSDGKEVDSATKEKRAALQASYEKQQKLGTACKAASDLYETAIKNLKESITSKNNSQKLTIQKETNKLVDEKTDEKKHKEYEEKLTSYTEISEEISSMWNRIQNEVRQTVETVYDNENPPTLISLFDMKILNESTLALEAAKDTDVSLIEAGFSKAIKTFIDFKSQEKELENERAEYNALLMKKA